MKISTVGGDKRIGKPPFYTKNAHVHTTITTPPRKVIKNLDTESSGKTTKNFFLLRVILRKHHFVESPQNLLRSSMRIPYAKKPQISYILSRPRSSQTPPGRKPQKSFLVICIARQKGAEFLKLWYWSNESAKIDI
jgi:hypothetical protein